VGSTPTVSAKELKAPDANELHPKSWTSIQPLGCFSWRSMTSDLNIGL